MKKILIIEDEEPIRRVLKRILTDENTEFKISEAIDGNEAIDKLSKDSNIGIHLYGKNDVKDGRKMGHINKITD